MSIVEIEKIIPHRPPFLWLDEVVSINEREILARKFLNREIELFRGHYPHFPVLPGVILCEAAFQAAAVLIGRQIPAGANEIPVVTRLNNTQFRRMVRPGETLDISAEVTERLQNTFFLKGKVSVEGQVAARLEFACTTTRIDTSAAQ